MKPSRLPVSFHPGAHWERCHVRPSVHSSPAQLWKPPKFDSSRRSLATAGISAGELDGSSSGARGRTVAAHWQSESCRSEIRGSDGVGAGSGGVALNRCLFFQRQNETFNDLKKKI